MEAFKFDFHDFRGSIERFVQIVTESDPWRLQHVDEMGFLLGHWDHWSDKEHELLQPFTSQRERWLWLEIWPLIRGRPTRRMKKMIKRRLRAFYSQKHLFAQPKFAKQLLDRRREIMHAAVLRDLQEAVVHPDRLTRFTEAHGLSFEQYVSDVF